MLSKRAHCESLVGYWEVDLKSRLEDKPTDYTARDNETLVYDKRAGTLADDRLEKLVGPEYPYVADVELTYGEWPPESGPQASSEIAPGKGKILEHLNVSLDGKFHGMGVSVAPDLKGLKESQHKVSHQEVVEHVLNARGVCSMNKSWHKPVGGAKGVGQAGKRLLRHMLSDPKFILNDNSRVLVVVAQNGFYHADWYLYRWFRVNTADKDSGRVLVPEAIFRSVPFHLALLYRSDDTIVNVFRRTEAEGRFGLYVASNDSKFLDSFDLVNLLKHPTEPVSIPFDKLPASDGPPGWQQAFLTAQELNRIAHPGNCQLMAPASLMLGLLSTRREQLENVQIAACNRIALDIEERFGGGNISGSHLRINTSGCNVGSTNAVVITAHSRIQINHRRHLWC